MRDFRVSATAVLAALVLSGCSSLSTKHGFYEPITAELRSGRTEAAAALLEKAREDNKYAEKDRLLYFLDAGFLDHYAGHWEASNQKLALVDAAAEELFTKSISRAAASLLLNDNVLEYAGEDYEILYADLIAALNYTEMHQYEDAFVEIRQANLKLQNLEQKYADAARQLQDGSPDDTARIKIDYNVDKVRFYNDAFARWLSMHMYAADAQWDDAKIDYNLMMAAYQEEPHLYPFEAPRVRYQSDSLAVLSVVGMAGLAPIKEGLSLRIRTDKDLDLVQVLYDGTDKADAEYTHFPVPINEDYYFKFAIPQLIDRPSGVAGAELYLDSTYLGRLQLIEDVGLVARETYNAKKSIVLIRTVARALAKGLATHKLKEKADTGGLGGWLKKAAIDVASDISENPDLRCSQFLPGRIYVGDFEVAPGTYKLTVKFVGSDGRQLGQTEVTGFEVVRGGLNLLSTQFID